MVAANLFRYRVVRRAAVALALAVTALLLPAGSAPALQKKDGGKLKFEVFQDAKKEFRWNLLAANGQTIATSDQGYSAKASCKKTIESIKENVADGKMKFEIYEDAKKEHRWRLIASNGQNIASSGQGYKAKADCEKGIELVKSGAKDAEVIERQ